MITSFHGMEEYIKKNGSRGTIYFCRTNKRIDTLLTLAGEKGAGVKRVSSSELDRLAGGNGHRGALLKETDSPGTQKFTGSQNTHGSQNSQNSRNSQSVHGTQGAHSPSSLKEFLKGSIPEQSLVVVLDSITDTHNLGAILRSADQFDADLVLLPERRSAQVNETVARTSAGASAWVPTLQVANLNRTLEALREAGYWIYGADMGGARGDSLDLRGRTCLVMGSEGKGISKLTRSYCDTSISIPTGGKIDSLNVSVAAGILMYEIRRQQNPPD